MSGNQKQPAAGGPQTQRYSSSPKRDFENMVSRFVPSGPVKQDGICLLPPPPHYRIMPPQRSDAFHNPAATYVSQTQGPNQGPLRNMQPTGPPNQSSTPPNSDLKVPNLPGQIPQMQFVQGGTVRAAPGTFFQSRGAGGPPTQASRMPNQQHRAQGPPQIYQSPYMLQQVYIPQQPSMFYGGNQRNPNNIMAPQTYAPQLFSQPISYQPYTTPATTGVSPFPPVFPMYPTQATTMTISRTSVTPTVAAPSNTTSGNLQNPALMTQPVPTHNNYRKNNARQRRRPNAVSIIDPATGHDMLEEYFDETNLSHPASGESSARQTPQPVVPDKQVQAAFAKQVAQALDQDKQPVDQQPPPLHEPSVPEHFNQPPPMQQVVVPRCDILNSNLQYTAQEFVSKAARQQPPIIKESTPIVSANSDAAEVILPKKDRESPVKGRKQGPRDPKPETPKEFQPKETDCDRSSSIVKEETVPVPQPTLVNAPVPATETSPLVAETAKEGVEKKDVVKKPAPMVEHKNDPEPETHQQPQPAIVEVVTSSNGKSKNARNKNVHNQNGKAQGPPQPQPQPQPQPPQPSLLVPPPQPPKPNNRSNKSKELNLKGANKEGTDMDAFNDNGPKTEINANVLSSPNEGTRVVSNDVLNANPIQNSATTVAPPILETDKVISETKQKDSNENVTTIKSETVNANDLIPATTTAASKVTIAAPASTKPVITPFNVTSIIKDTAPKSIVPPFPLNDNRDETDKSASNDTLSLPKNDAYNNKNSIENTVNDIKSEPPYEPGQWKPSDPDGRKVYQRDFLLALRNYPASRQKPNNIPESILLDERNRQIDSRSSMGGRTDFINPPFPNYGGKSGSQRGTLPKRNSQSGKMGSRGGDKSTSKAKLTISLRGDIKLHEAENAWKPARFVKGENMSDDDKKTASLYKRVRAVLNKLTPQKFDTLVNQVRQLQIDNKDRLQGVIDLVFEKAIDEPNFSLAYAMMCKEIQNMQVSIGDSVGDEKKHLAFRTLLVTRCQAEFEKQSIDESERNNKLKEIQACADQDKKKELTFELEEYDRRLRMKSVGTIRFIGELFKQQMLTASIMKRCLQTLLDNKDEESLECLCKLLTTVGKELESKNVELTTIFDEMKRITDGKRQKVSSRIRFMLQDVIELKDSKWVPRRGDTNPKTIDQIQKEAETEQHMSQVMNINMIRKDDRGGPRGGGGGGSGPRQKMSDDGWSSVGSRNRQQQTFSIQTDKMRAPKVPMSEEVFGSPSMFGTWGKGAGAAKNPQPSSNTSTSNMYTALENMDMDRRPMNTRGNKDSYSSKGPSMERNTYKNYDGRGSRSGSQHRDSAAPMRSTGPPPSSGPILAPPQPKPQPYQAPLQPAPPSAPSVPKLSDEQIERRIRNTLEEYIGGFSTPEEFFKEIALVLEPNDYSKAVYHSYSFTIEKSQTLRSKAGELFAVLIKSGILSIEDFIKGFEPQLEMWEDLEIDIPQVWQYYAECIVPLLLGEVLPFPKLLKLLEGLVQRNVAKKLLKPLFALVVKEKGPNFLHNSWQNSGSQLSDFMPDAEVQSFVQDNNLEFLSGGSSPVGQSQLSYEDIQKKLSEFFQSKTPLDDIMNWISANAGKRVKENKFIRALATAIFENSISKNKLQAEVLGSHTTLFQKYVDNDTNYELECLYALQSLIHKLEHPSGLLLAICDKLYEDAIFSQESLVAWENSTDPAEQEGKGVALKQLTSFFTRLRENEDDEYSSSEDA